MERDQNPTREKARTNQTLLTGAEEDKMKYLVRCQEPDCDKRWIVATEAIAKITIDEHKKITTHDAYIADDCYEPVRS